MSLGRTTIQVRAFADPATAELSVLADPDGKHAVTFSIQTERATLVLRPTLAEAQQIIEALQLAILKTGAPE